MGGLSTFMHMHWFASLGLLVGLARAERPHSCLFSLFRSRSRVGPWLAMIVQLLDGCAGDVPLTRCSSYLALCSPLWLLLRCYSLAVSSINIKFGKRLQWMPRLDSARSPSHSQALLPSPIAAGTRTLQPFMSFTMSPNFPSAQVDDTKCEHTDRS